MFKGLQDDQPPGCNRARAPSVLLAPRVPRREVPAGPPLADATWSAASMPKQRGHTVLPEAAPPDLKRDRGVPREKKEDCNSRSNEVSGSPFLSYCVPLRYQFCDWVTEIFHRR